MLIAAKKKEENIAEYILYMYQIEDIVRSFHFDLERIMDEYVRQQLPDQSFFASYKKWYENIILQMKSKKLEAKGGND